MGEMGKAQGITGLAISPARWGDRNTGKDRGRVACCHLESIGGFSANGNYIEPVPATRLEVWRLSAKNDKRFCSGQAPASLSSCCWVTAPASRPLSPPSPASSSSRLRVHGYGGGGAACDRRASGVEHGLFVGESWIAASTALYLLTGALWLPVVWMQMRMRDLACEAAARSSRPNIIVSLMVRLRFAGLRRCLSHLLADDRQAAALVETTLPLSLEIATCASARGARASAYSAV